MTWHSRCRTAAWSVYRGRSVRPSSKLPQAAGVERYLEDVDAARGQLQRVLDRLREQRANRNGPSLAHPLDAQLVIGRGRDVVEDFDARQFGCGRQQIIGQGAVDELAFVVEHQPFVKGVADPLGDATLDLAGDDKRID